VGERLVAAGDARAVHQRALPGAPDAVRNLQRVAVRTDLVAHTFASLDAPGETRPLPPLLAALARGDRRDVPDEQLAVLRRTGTAHLLAISGFHVGLVAWGLASMAARSSRLASLARPRGADTTWLLGAPGLAAALFTLQVGAPVSAQRATLVVCLVAWHRFGGRHLTGGSLLGVAAVVVLVADPAAIGSPSFQLSFGAVAGLVTWGPALERLLPPDLPRWARFLLTGLIASTSTTLGTLPAAAWWFQSTAPVGLVTNLFAIPWTAVLVHLALAAAHLPDPVHLPFVTLGDGAAQLLLHTLALFDVDPWTPATTAAGALCCTSIFLARRPSLAVLGVLFGLALRPLSTELVLTQLDVGQGSATLVSFPDGRHWLIDGGYPGEAVLAHLRRRGIRRLSKVAATHGDLDHTGGLGPVLAHLEVGSLHVSHDAGMEALLAIAEDRGVPVVRSPASRLWPEGDTVTKNDGSLVLAAQGAHRMLLTGDISATVERDLEWIGRAAVLLLPHHGSRSSSSEAFLDVVDPTLALVSAGRGNHFGHPHSEVVSRLARRGTPLLRTDLHGTIEVRSSASGLRWRHHQPGRGWSRLVGSP
jgi:competence protein ComEC